LLNVGAKDRQDKLTLLRTAVHVIKNNPQFVTKNLEYILNVARNKDVACGRTALSTLAEIAKIDTSVMTAASSFLPKYSVEVSKKNPNFSYGVLVPAKKEAKKTTLLPHFNTEDPDSRFALCSLCSMVIPELKLPTRADNFDNEGSGGGAYDDKYLEFLKVLLHDENLMVFFETVKQTALRNFSFFLNKDFNSQTISVLDFVVKRLCNSLSKVKPQTQIYHACRAAQYLMTSFAKYTTYCTVDPYPDYPIDSPEMKQAKATLQRLYDGIDDLLAYDCAFVRFEAFKAMLWREETVEAVVQQLKMEVKSNAVWTAFHIHELMFTLLRFSRVQFAMFDILTDFISFICIYLSERLDVDMLIALFRVIIPEKETPKRHQITSKFLQMIFHILDNCLTGSKESVQLSFSLYSFLGDVANKLTGEPRDEKETPMAPSNKKKLDPKEIFDRAEVFDIQNGAMKAIVLRLVHNCMYNTPQIRTACVESLAKIAFRSLGAVRLFIYEVFQYLSQIPYFGLSAQAIGMIQVLNEVYTLQQRLVKLLYKQPSDQELLEFYDYHEQIKKKISFFTRVPPSFLVVGRASQGLLAKGYDLQKR
jgi:hypothetical protein